METENNLLKVLSLYIGSKVQLNNGGSLVNNRVLIAIGGYNDAPYLKLRLGETDFNHAILIQNGNFKLILKPLSSITDEDRDFCKKEFDMKLDFHPSGTDNFCYESHGNFNCIAGCVQYLQSKGYDLPQYLLGGKTLKEAGLAIHESETTELTNV